MRRVLRIPWKAGPAAGIDGPVLVSFTAFTPRRRTEMPAIARSGFSLRHAWPEIEGAVGVWLWADPTMRRGGSVSMWESEFALMQFVAWKPHVEIMRRYRDRGSIETVSWKCERYDSAEAWKRAEKLLASPDRPFAH